MNSQSFADRCFHRAAIMAWAIFIGLVLNEVAAAKELEDPDRILAIATQYAQEHAGQGRNIAQARMPDSRLYLPRCEQQPQATANQHGLRMQVRVSCPGSWSLYVPVSVEQHKQVVFTRRSLAANEVVSAADVELAWKQIKSGGYGHFESLESVVGRKLIRPVNAGKILQPNQLRQAWSIHKGDTVTLISRAGAVEIRGRGKAEQDALENNRVRVRNLSSGKVVEGYARGNGIVEIQG
ncbi:MAG: flagellar basal body P-ring formation chaperone FlgA [Oceanococcus sp.]